MKYSNFSVLILTLLTFFACSKSDDIKELDKKDDQKIENDDGKWEEKECFELIYPVTYTLPDGSAVTGNEEEVWEAIKAWYEANESDEKPELNYPVQIAYPESDELATINSEEEMEAAKKECYEEDEEKEECFELVYPVTYTLHDGTSVTGNEEEVWEAIKAWYEANESDEKPELNYPVQIAFPESDGLFTINSEERKWRPPKRNAMKRTRKKKNVLTWFIPSPIPCPMVLPLRATKRRSGRKSKPGTRPMSQMKNRN